MKKKIIFGLASALLCVGVLVPVTANAVSDNTNNKTVMNANTTTSQSNIVARANYLYNTTWTAKATVKGWNNAYTFSKGSTYHLPYGQPIYSGQYIGFGVSVDDFITATKNASSSFYTKRSKYNKESVYYASDCSSFVSWSWGISRQTTSSIPNVASKIGAVTTTNVKNSLKLGDALNYASSHVVLVTGLTYDSSGAVSKITITEQTPPQLKRTTYTVSGLVSKYGSSYTIYRYTGSVKAAPSTSATTEATQTAAEETTTKATTTKTITTTTKNYAVSVPSIDTSASVLKTSQTLKSGSTGTQVQYLQYALARFDYYTDTIDSDYGSNTTAAVKKFQKDAGLDVDGIAGPKTLTALVKKAMTLQAQLKALNYYTGSVNGCLGSTVLSAIKAFQTASGLDVDGIVGPNTTSSLKTAIANGYRKSLTVDSYSTSSSLLTTSQTLKSGSSGTQVKYLQYALTRFGYYTGSIDGSYGSGTVAAVKKYQKDASLSVDGIAGPNTLTSLVKKAMKLQANLKALGYYTDTVDGALGPNTKTAITSFQSTTGLTVDGVVGTKTSSAINVAVKYGRTKAIEAAATKTSSTTETKTTSDTTAYSSAYEGGMAGSGKVLAQGLDLSSWQGDSLDFSKIKAAGYSYVILRAGTTKGKDTCFETNYTKAKAAGLNVGAYMYSYATTADKADDDADLMISWLSGKKFEYPVYFDFEDPTQASLSKATAKSICLTWMDKLAKEDYLVGMYTSASWVTTFNIPDICEKYEFWIARYYDYTYQTLGDTGSAYSKSYGMYQYSSKVTFTQSGTSFGPFDGDVCYKDYPTIVKTYHFNGY